MSSVYTIGHSTHPAHVLVELLQAHQVTAVGDVRSRPFSRMNPQFNRPELKETLRGAGIAYSFLGNELGAQTDDESCYVGGRVNYGRLAQTPLFRRGIERVVAGLGTYRIALLCAEKDPLACHRTILVSRQLVKERLGVNHILENGTIETQQQAEDRLLEETKLPQADLFRARADILDEAYRRRERDIAYADPAHGGDSTKNTI